MVGEATVGVRHVGVALEHDDLGIFGKTAGPRRETHAAGDSADHNDLHGCSRRPTRPLLITGTCIAVRPAHRQELARHAAHNPPRSLCDTAGTRQGYTSRTPFEHVPS